MNKGEEPTAGNSSRWKRRICTYRALFCLGIVAFAAELAFAVVNQSAIPPYVQMLGLTAHIGLIYAAFLISETVLKSVMGTVGDRIGRRPVLVLGTLLSGGAALALVFTNKLWVIILMQILSGIGAASVWPTIVAAVGGSVGSEKRTMAMSFLTVTYIAAVAIAPLLGGLANDLTNTKTASFYLVGVLFIMAALVSYFLTPHRSKEEEEAHHEEGSKFHIKDVLIGLKTIPDMMFMAFIAFFGIGLLIPIVKLFAMDEMKLSETGFGGLILPIAAAVGAVSFVAGRLGDRWGKSKAVHLGLGVCALSMWAISFSHRAWELGAAGMVLGVGFVITMPAWLALVSDMTAPRIRGAVIGALGTAQGIGAVIGAYLGSRLYEHVSIDLGPLYFSPHYAPFAASAAALTICWVLSMIFIRKDEARRLG